MSGMRWKGSMALWNVRCDRLRYRCLFDSQNRFGQTGDRKLDVYRPCTGGWLRDPFGEEFEANVLTEQRTRRHRRHPFRPPVNLRAKSKLGCIKVTYLSRWWKLQPRCETRYLETVHLYDKAAIRAIVIVCLGAITRFRRRASTNGEYRGFQVGRIQGFPRASDAQSACRTARDRRDVRECSSLK